MAGIFSYIKNHPAFKLGQVVWALLGLIVGYFGHDFLSFRSEERAGIRADYSQVQTQAAMIRTELQDFSQVALGRRSPPTPTEVAQLRTNISQLYAAAQHVVVRVPHAKDTFSESGNAMLQLQLSAEQLKGPLDGKPFVESVSAYFVAEKKFDQEIVAAQCFFCMA
jgi:hypothetical protein